MRRKQVCGFSLLEVVIVVAIIAILAAIGIPRMSRGSKGAGDSALQANLAVLRNAIDLFSAEHQGTYPALLTFSDQLTQYTTSAGSAQATKDATHIYGPYLRSVPALPVGTYKGATDLAAVYTADPNIGWVYVAGSGDIIANTNTEADDKGVLYNTY